MNAKLQELLARKERLAALPKAFVSSPSPVAQGSATKAITKLIRKKEGEAKFHDVDRICAIPLREDLTPGEIEAFNRRHVLSDAYRSGFRFNKAQVSAFVTYLEEEGGFYSVGVGNGKTAIGLFTASLAYHKGKRKILLLVPPQVYAQLMKYDLAWARKRFTLGMPVIGLGNTSATRRRALVTNKQRGLFVMPYSLLSIKDTDFLLNSIGAELIIGDEGHNLKNLQTARTKRLVKHIDETEPELIVMSGTITDKTIKDYAHLIRRALKEGSPLPLSDHTANDWAVILDSSSEQRSGDEATGPLMPLVYWARRNFPDTPFAPTQAGFRKAYKHRLIWTPGVVTTPDSGVNCSLVFSNLPAESLEDLEETDPTAADLTQLIEQVEEEWVTPSGDEIEFSIHTYKWLYELSAGFYNNLYWPEAKDFAKRLRLNLDDAADQLYKAQVHHAHKQEYNKALRDFLRDEQITRLDTPWLVGSHFYNSQRAKRNPNDRIPLTLYKLWQTMKSLEWKGMPERDSEVIRVCDYKVRALVAWLDQLPAKTKAKGGIIWVYHKGAGRWCFEALKEAGYDALYCPAGTVHNETILASRKQWIVASIKAHGTGKNLQHHENQYYFQWPRQATTAEQSLGRLHRQGQEADVLNVVSNITSPFDRLCLAACLNDALYIHQTTGTPQKVIYGSYNPVPQVFPAEVLKERGLSPKTLTKEQQELLAEKFAMTVDLS